MSDAAPPAGPDKTAKPVDPVAMVARMLIAGNSTGDILEYLEANHMTVEAAKFILQEAFNAFVKSARLPAEVRKGWCLDSMRHLYRKMESTGDYSGALSAVKEIAKLADLYPGTGKTKEKPPIEGTQDEISTFIDEVFNLL